MRIAVISDIHANVVALDAVLKDVKSNCIDSVVFLGDLVMTGPRPNEAFDMIKSINPVIWIQGNTDNWLEEINDNFVPQNSNEAFCKALRDYSTKYLQKRQIEEILNKPVKHEYTYRDIQIIFCHGSPLSFSQAILMSTDIVKLDEIVNSTSASVICCGHTHIKTNIKYKDKTIINFGSVSIPGNDYSRMARYGIIEVDEKSRINFESREVQFDIEMFFRDMKDRKYPGIERIRERYRY